MIVAVSDDRFDSLTDAIGIPLAVLALVLLVVIDLRREAGRPRSRNLFATTAALSVATLVLVAVRFAVLTS